MICFIPAAGVFYSVRDRRKEDVGIENTFFPLDMSWLRMCRDLDGCGSPVYRFGDGGYVRRFASDMVGNKREDSVISAWRVR